VNRENNSEENASGSGVTRQPVFNPKMRKQIDDRCNL